MDVKTILLVVADAARRVAIGEALRLEAHSVLVVESTEEAVEVVRSIAQPASLIVTDQRLDVGEGRILASLVASRIPTARILLLTGFGAITPKLATYFLDRDASPEAVARVASRIVSQPSRPNNELSST